MKRKNPKEIVIKMIKDLAGVACVGVTFFSILLMFCQPTKVIDMIFCREVIGLLGLLIGGILGFVFGAILTYKHFANEIATLEDALDKKIYRIRKLEHDNINKEAFINNSLSSQRSSTKTSDKERASKFFSEISDTHTSEIKEVSNDDSLELEVDLQEDSPIENV